MNNSVSLRVCSSGGNVFKGISVIFDIAATRTELNKSIYTDSLTNDSGGEEMVVVEVGKPSTVFSYSKWWGWHFLLYNNDSDTQKESPQC